ncbi:hypothetical protein C0991_008690 [Blastosporella zonata]|nr:hypothetical protein C0991_008690 [Blastosporella zonata]
MEFLWVRWLGSEPCYSSGRQYAKLPKIGFVPENDAYAFGFLDPACVIRGSHLIPTFTAGKSSDLLTAQRTAARPAGVTKDWLNFYVNVFVDRDMFFRYLGGGIGHLSPAINSDEDPSDNEDPEVMPEDYRDNDAPDQSGITTNAGILDTEEDEEDEEEEEEEEEDWQGDEDENDGGADNEDEGDSGDEDIGYADL